MLASQMNPTSAWFFDPLRIILRTNPGIFSLIITATFFLILKTCRASRSFRDEKYFLATLFRKTNKYFATVFLYLFFSRISECAKCRHPDYRCHCASLETDFQRSKKSELYTYFRKRCYTNFLGVEFFVINSTYLFTKLKNRGPSTGTFLANETFVSRAIVFSRGLVAAIIDDERIVNNDRDSSPRLCKCADAKSKIIVRRLGNSAYGARYACSAESVGSSSSFVMSSSSVTVDGDELTSSLEKSSFKPHSEVRHRKSRSICTMSNIVHIVIGKLRVYKYQSLQKWRLFLLEYLVDGIVSSIIIPSELDGSGSKLHRYWYLKFSQGSPCSATFSSSIETKIECLYKKSYPLVKACVKELIIVLEAKSNRNSLISIKSICFRHVMNVLGVCMFGKTIKQLSSSRCPFYKCWEQLYNFWLDSEKRGAVDVLEECVQERDYTDGSGLCKSSSKLPVDAIHYLVKLIDEEASRINVQDSEEDDVNTNIHEKRHLARNIIQLLIANCEKFSSSDGVISSTALSSLLIASCLHILEIMTGIMSIILYVISANDELQRNIRINNKIAFDLDGFPVIRLEEIMRDGDVDRLIEEILKNYPVEPVVRMIYEQPFVIPDTNIRLDSSCTIVIPTWLLECDEENTRDDAGTNLLREYRQCSNGDSEKESVIISTAVSKFIKICLKVSLISLLQEYEFRTNDHTSNSLINEAVKCCRFSSLPDCLFTNVAKVGKYEKGAILAESLKIFHATNNLTFLSKIGF